MNRCVQVTIALLVVAVQHHSMVAADCANEYKDPPDHIILSFGSLILEAASQPPEGLQCLELSPKPFTYTFHPPGAVYTVNYMKDGTIIGMKAEVHLCNMTAIGYNYSALPFRTEQGETVYFDFDGQKYFYFRPIFSSSTNCLVLEQLIDDTTTGNYYLFRSADAERKDYEPCVEKLKKCSDQEVTLLNEGRDCS